MEVLLEQKAQKLQQIRVTIGWIVHAPSLATMDGQLQRPDVVGIHDYDADPEKICTRYSDKTQDLFDHRRPRGCILTLHGYPHPG